MVIVAEYKERQLARLDERVFKEKVPGWLHHVPWAGPKKPPYKIPAISIGVAMVYEQEEEKKRMRPDTSSIEWCPFIGDGVSIGNLIADWIQSWAPEVRASRQSVLDYAESSD